MAMGVPYNVVPALTQKNSPAGPNQEHIFFDSLGAGQNSDASGTVSAQGLIQAVDDGFSKNVKTTVDNMILWRNPA